jgi:hypothetical protein
VASATGRDRFNEGLQDWTDITAMYQIGPYRCVDVPASPAAIVGRKLCLAHENTCQDVFSCLPFCQLCPNAGCVLQLLR